MLERDVPNKINYTLFDKKWIEAKES
jgi:hypothetical protein